MEKLTLKTWMDSKGYSNSELARIMKLSYEYIYKLSTGRAELGYAFKGRFVECFGMEEAGKIFDAVVVPEVA